MITLADIDARTREALACGALARIETIEETIPERGAVFVVRRVSSLARKAEAARPVGELPRRNPFLPPEPELTVGAIGPAHLAVLNKYPVIDRHLLIVTRAFAPQEALIDASDFAALAAVMRGFPSLGFYNGGKAAGASQPHKHLQVVPLPLGRGETPFPVAPWIDAVRRDGAAARVPQFEFAHGVARFGGETIDGADAGASLEAIYRGLLEHIGIGQSRVDGLALQSAPYNLLVGRDWMLAVRRAREHADGISVNTLGYAGSLFVKDEAQLALVRRIGPLAVLRSVAAPVVTAA